MIALAIFFVFTLTYVTLAGLSIAAARANGERITGAYHAAILMVSIGNAVFWIAIYWIAKFAFGLLKV